MILFRYICREIYLCMLVIAIIVVSVLVINSFSHFLKIAAAGQLSIHTIILLVGLQLPVLLTYVLPLALYLGILISIGRLYTDHEMTVMTACGMSFFRQVLIVGSLAVLVALFSAWLSLLVVPRFHQLFSTLKINSVHEFQIGTLVPHRFESFGNAKVIYVNKVNHHQNKADDIFMAVQRTDQNTHEKKWDIVRASKAYQTTKPDSSSRFIVFADGTHYSVKPDNLSMTSSTFKSVGINILGGFLYGHKKPPEKAKYNVGELSTTELYKLIDIDPAADAEFQLRVSVPVSILISSLIAVALSRVDPRRGRYFNMLPAISIYIVYATMVFLCTAWVRKGVIPGSLGAWWLHGLMFMVMLGLFCWRVGLMRVKRLIFRVT